MSNVHDDISKLTSFIRSRCFTAEISLNRRGFIANALVKSYMRMINHPPKSVNSDENRKVVHIRSPLHNGSRLFEANSLGVLGQLPILE